MKRVIIILSLVLIEAMGNFAGALEIEKTRLASAFDLSKNFPATVNIKGYDIKFNNGIVNLEDGIFKSNCTGVKISERLILTAAHCLKLFQISKDKTDEKIILLSSVTTLAKEIKILDVFPHPKYDSKNIHFDIAILQLENDLSEVPKAKLNFKTISDENLLYIGGYGRNNITSDGGVLLMDERMSGTVSQDIMSIPAYEHEKFVSNIALGDSGGPVYKKVGNTFEVVGINSFRTVSKKSLFRKSKVRDSSFIMLSHLEVKSFILETIRQLSL